MTAPYVLFSILRWVFWHLARLAGALLSVWSVVAGVGDAYVNRNFQTASWLVLLLAAALPVAVFADRRLRAVREEVKQKRAEIAAKYEARGELVAGVDWTLFVALIASIIVGLLGVIGLWQTLDGEQLLNRGSLICLVFLIVSIFWGVSMARLAWRALSAEYVLKLGPGGLSHCLGYEVAWQNVRGVDIKTFGVRFRQEYLVLTLSATKDETLSVARRPGLWDRLFIRFVGAGCLQISCSFIAMPPLALGDAVRRFAQRFAPRTSANDDDSQFFTVPEDEDEAGDELMDSANDDDSQFVTVPEDEAGDELVTVGVRWFALFVRLTGLIVVGLFCGIGLWLALDGKQIGGIGPDDKQTLLHIGLLIVSVILIGCALWSVAVARLIWRALSARYVLKLGPGGIRHCLGYEVAWQDVRGADAIKAGRTDYLVLTLSAIGVETLRAARMPGRWDWLFIRFVGTDCLKISCTSIDMHASALATIIGSLARGFTQQASVNFDSDRGLLSK